MLFSLFCETLYPVKSGSKLSAQKLVYYVLWQSGNLKRAEFSTWPSKSYKTFLKNVVFHYTFQLVKFHDQTIFDSKDTKKCFLPRVLIPGMMSQFLKLMEWSKIQKINYVKNGTQLFHKMTEIISFQQRWLLKPKY